MGGKRPEARLQAPPVLQDLAFCYNSAKEFYDPSKVAATIAAAAKKADRNVALAVFVLAGTVTFLLAFLTSLESVYLVNYSSDLVSQMSGIPQPRLELESLIPVAIYQILLYVPASIVVALLHEAITFGIFRATGGRGKFWTQVFLASIIGLSISFSGVLSFFVPLPCLQIVAGIGIFVLTLYFMFYVTGKAYMEIHGISALHAGVVILFLAIARLAVLAVLTNALAVLMGLPTPINLPEGV
ncbi:MAG TPA: hypothetical protein VLD37_06235 [Candidatus Bilamarchaeum sp.]|nr:hypothetical protein [Candidatus Bilamarchaeum sp.]